MRKAIGLFLVGMAAAGVLCSRVEAGLVTVHIQGEILVVDDPASIFTGNISVGDLFTGSYTYETTLADTVSAPDHGVYRYEEYPGGLELNIEGYHFAIDEVDGWFTIETMDNYYGKDIVRYSNHGPHGTEVSPALPIAVREVYWELMDSTGASISGDSLPEGPPVLSDWDYNCLVIRRIITHGPDMGLSFELVGHVTSASVPEPGTILLFCIGGVFLRRRK